MIRNATPDDLEQVLRWLQQEKDDGHESFICNFNLIEAGQKNNSLTVLVDDIPIAFALGDTNLAILAVKRDRRAENGRGQRVGSTLALHWIQEARVRDLMGFHGECASRRSLEFWMNLGCMHVAPPHSNCDIPWVAMPFRANHELPDGVPTVPLTFEVHAPDGELMPEWSFSTTAAVISSDDYMLAKDFVAFVPETDARLTIRENGKQVANSKVRDVGEFGGERDVPWIRVRYFCPQ
jgi:hypothetical protein